MYSDARYWQRKADLHTRHLFLHRASSAKHMQTELYPLTENLNQTLAPPLINGRA
jgi:hypothetical protein